MEPMKILDECAPAMQLNTLQDKQQEENTLHTRSFYANINIPLGSFLFSFCFILHSIQHMEVN